MCGLNSGFTACAVVVFQSFVAKGFNHGQSVNSILTLVDLLVSLILGVDPFPQAGKVEFQRAFGKLER